MKQQIDSKKWILPYGLGMGIALMLLTYYKSSVGNQYQSSTLITVLGWLILVVFIAYPIYKFHLTSGINSVRTALKIGLGIAAIGAITNVVYMMIYANYINPEFAETVTQIQVEEMKKMSENLTEEEFKERYQTLRKLIMPYLYAGIIGINLFFGLVISFIMGALLKQPSNNS